jgi:segregation and condensation protein B
MTETPPLKQIIEGALLAAGEPMPVSQLEQLYAQELALTGQTVLDIIHELQFDYEQRALELVTVASGYRIQIRSHIAPWVARLWDLKPSRYSRATLETLAIIAYQQPVTRSDIEKIRGVSVSPHSIKTLLEREWIRIVGHRHTPGRPALYGTTRQFLDDLNVQHLQELPPLPAPRTLVDHTPSEDDSPQAQLPLDVERPA